MVKNKNGKKFNKVKITIGCRIAVPINIDNDEWRLGTVHQYDKKGGIVRCMMDDVMLIESFSAEDVVVTASGVAIEEKHNASFKMKSSIK